MTYQRDMQTIVLDLVAERDRLREALDRIAVAAREHNDDLNPLWVAEVADAALSGPGSEGEDAA